MADGAYCTQAGRASDPRVKQEESDQIVAAMKAANIPVTYVQGLKEAIAK